MSRPAIFTAIVLEKILGFLAPLFANECKDDPAAARQVARETLASYGARNDRELRLAALAMAFGFGALDALCRAADPDLALNQVLRLRGNASALNRAANQTENKLEKLRKQPIIADTADPAPADDTLPITAATPDLLAFTRLAPTPKAEIPAKPAQTLAKPAVAAPLFTTPTAAALTFTAPAVAASTAARPAFTAPLSRQQRRAAERSAEKLRRQQQAAAERMRRAAGRASSLTAAPTQFQPKATVTI